MRLHRYLASVVMVFVSAFLVPILPAASKVNHSISQYQGQGPSDGEFSAWTKLVDAGLRMKFYVKYPEVGQKIQFLAQQGGEPYREIAWKRLAQSDLSDSGAYTDLQNHVYFIRTVDLKPGKNRFKILVDGRQLGSTKTYSLPEVNTLPVMPWQQVSPDQVLSTFVSRTAPDYPQEVQIVQLGENFDLVEGAQLKITDIGIYDLGSDEYQFSVSRKFSWEKKRLGMRWGHFSILFENGDEMPLCYWNIYCSEMDFDDGEEGGIIFNEALPYGKTPYMLKINPSATMIGRGMPTYGILLSDPSDHFNTYQDSSYQARITGMEYRVQQFQGVVRIDITGIPERLVGKELVFKQLRRSVDNWDDYFRFPEAMFTREITSDSVTILVTPVESVLWSTIFVYAEEELLFDRYVRADVVPEWVRKLVEENS